MFTWKKEFELGINSIDTQHKRLIEIGNKIDELLSIHDDTIDNYDYILDILDELLEYTKYHFKTEEDLFIRYKYPEYDNHKKEHDDFIAYLNSIDIKNVDENQGEFLKELLRKVVSWVFKHILTTDYLYKDFLIKSVASSPNIN